MNGSRARIADAFDALVEEVLQTVRERLALPQALVEVDAATAPVRAVVLRGDDADLTRLPVHFQHGLDGGPYISAALDHVIDPETGLTNLGCRRMMLRGRTEAGVDLNGPSDLRAIYERASARGEKLPVNFVLGAHPTDHVAASMRVPAKEIELIARLRGQPMAVVRGLTNDILVPADVRELLDFTDAPQRNVPVIGHPLPGIPE